MLFPSSRPNRIPPPSTDSQYDTATGYSSSSYTKWPRPPVRTGLYAARNVGSAITPASRQYKSIRRRNNNHHINNSFTDISAYQYFQPKEQQQQQPQQHQEEQQQPIFSTVSPRRPTVNYLLP